MTPRVREILSWYNASSPSIAVKLAQILNHGQMGGTGKLFFADFSCGIERGPAEAFAKNPNSYDPAYLMKTAMQQKLSAVIAPLGILELVMRDFAGEIPFLLKLDHTVQLNSFKSHYQSSQLRAAVRLGCQGVVHTLPVGGVDFADSVSKLSRNIEKASSWGLVSMVSVCRAGHVEDEKKRENLPVDQATQAAHLAVQAGAHIIEIPALDLPVVSLREWYLKKQIPVEKVSQRVELVLQACMGKQRIVLNRFSNYWDEGEKDQRVKTWSSAGSFGINLGQHFYQNLTDETQVELNTYRQHLLGVE